MRIAVINEVSCADSNADIMSALGSLEHEIVNVGMKSADQDYQLTYIHTGFLGALLLNLKVVDFVIGGCGTGIGFMNSIMQYPNILCGHITNVLDAWLFTKINNGNAISLALKQGYGWAGDVNLKFIFENIFNTTWGEGYPVHRRKSQEESRDILKRISQASHMLFHDIIGALPRDVVEHAVNYPGIVDLIRDESVEDRSIRAAIENLQTVGRL